MHQSWRKKKRAGKRSGIIATFVLATRNRGKIRELEALLHGLPVRIVGLADFPEMEETEETGATFEENALLKARAAAAHTGLVALADDSGLEVAALGGRPGVHSARFCADFGETPGDEANIRKLLELLRDVPPQERRANFTCVAALAAPDGETLVRRGEWHGFITQAPAGTGGFGYDPVFSPILGGPTAAQMTKEEKNALSHRARAFAALCQSVPDFLRRRESKGL